MDNLESTGPLLPDESDKKAKKKEKREYKDQLAVERTSLALDRTLLAMVRTATTFMTFGFAIYKLLTEKAAEPGDHPILRVFTPRAVALILFFTGLVGLVFQMFSVVGVRRRIQLYTPGYWRSPVVLLSYVIVFMLLLLITGVLLGRA